MRFFATCAKGTEGALRRELVALRLGRVRGDRGGVAFEGPLEAGMGACLHVRTAMRVLLELGSGSPRELAMPGLPPTGTG